MRLRFLAPEFSCKIPFGVSKVEIDEKEGFKKGFRGIGDFFLKVGGLKITKNKLGGYRWKRLTKLLLFLEMEQVRK